jgi:hypothetical protein
MQRQALSAPEMSPKELKLLPSDTFQCSKKPLTNFVRNSGTQTPRKLISPPQTIGMAFASLPIGILVAKKGSQNGQTEKRGSQRLRSFEFVETLVVSVTRRIAQACYGPQLGKLQ